MWGTYQNKNVNYIKHPNYDRLQEPDIHQISKIMLAGLMITSSSLKSMIVPVEVVQYISNKFSTEVAMILFM